MLFGILLCATPVVMTVDFKDSSVDSALNRLQSYSIEQRSMMSNMLNSGISIFMIALCLLVI